MNGRPVRLAPFSPGASPTMSSRASASPKEATGALWKSGYLARLVSRKSLSRGQSAQSRPGPSALGIQEAGGPAAEGRRWLVAVIDSRRLGDAGRPRLARL